MADIVKYHLQVYSSQLPNNEKPTTKVAANVFQELCYNNKDGLTAGIICAGYDKQNKGSVYLIPIGGSIHQQDYAIAGSGSTFIYGWCNENYKPEMEKDDCVQFIKTALSEAIKWDGSSGGVIRMVILTEKGVERLIFYPEDYQK